MEMKTEQKRVEHIKSSSAREIHSTKFHTFFFFLKFHTLKKNQKEQQISVLMIWLKMLKIRANQIQTQLIARNREN